MSSFGDIPLLRAIRSKMEYHEFRQKVLAGNVANGATPGFRPNEVTAPNYFSEVARTPMMAAEGPLITNAAHISGPGLFENTGFARKKTDDFEVKPNGNSVSIEDEMMKVTANQMDFQTAASLYQRGLGLIKVAIGKA